MQRLNFREIQEKLSKCTVGIAGAGGLGSNCAVALARVGIGKLVIADFDTIVESNLNRQYFFINQIGIKKVEALKTNIEKINPKVIVEVFDVKVVSANVSKLFGNCDVLVEAFDKADQKQMLIETMLEYFPQIPLVLGVGMAGFGANELIKTEKYGNLYCCGDKVNEIAEELPPLAPRVGIVANMQANVVLEILLNPKS